MIKGVNLGGWFSQADYSIEHFNNFIKKQDLKLLKESGATHIRLPFDGYAVLKNDASINEEGYNLLIEKSNEILDFGFKLILDFHIPPWFHFMDFFNKKKITFFEDDELIEKHIEILLKIINPFLGNDNVYLEVLNEPVAPENFILNKFYRKVIKALRKNGVTNKLVIESNRWGGVEGFDDLEYFSDLGDIIYSFHFYRTERFTHQRAPWMNYPVKEILDYPYVEEWGEKINKDFIVKLLQPVLNFREKYGANVFCGEFGVYLKAPRESRFKWIKDFLDVLEENNIGHTYWNYKNLDFGIIETQKEFLNYEEFKTNRNVDVEFLKLLRNYW